MMLLRKQNRRASITRARKAPISPPPGAHSLRFLEGKMKKTTLRILVASKRVCPARYL